MKILVFLLLVVTGTLCEIPPPYSNRDFRPNSQLSLPQRTYGVPNAEPQRQLPTKYGPPPPSNAEPLDPSFSDESTPIKFTVYNKYRTITETFEPIRAPQRFNGGPRIVNNNKQPQFLKQQQLPQVQVQNVFNPVPQRLYGVPGAPEKQQLPQSQPLNPPQTTYGVPITSSQWTQGGSAAQPQINYGAPDAPKVTADAATLAEIRELKQVLQRIEALRLAEQRNNQYLASQIIQQQNKQTSNRFVQNLPTPADSRFRNSLSDQYLPVKEPENFRKFVSPTTTQDSASTNFEDNIGRIPPNRYIPPNPNNNNQVGSGSSGSPGFGVAPTNSWNNLDLPDVNNGNPKSTNGFSNSVPVPNNVPSVDIQKVEVTQFGPRNRNRNSGVGSGSTFKPPVDDLGASSNEDRVNNRYIPPTIENPVQRGALPTTPSPPSAEPNFVDQSNVAETPNIAVATAVAVPQDDQQYFLLQPDGTYQTVVLQRGRQEKALPYGQNYVLQNLRSNANIAYTPIVGILGK